MAFFLRPKDTNLDRANDHINAEAIGVSNEGFEAEYTDGASVAQHRRRHPSEAAEPKANAPLPSGNWRGGGTRRGSIGRGRRR
jgi:hypothetical protein